MVCFFCGGAQLAVDTTLVSALKGDEPAMFYLGQSYSGQVLLGPILLGPILLRPGLLRPGSNFCFFSDFGAGDAPHEGLLKPKRRT